MKTHATLCGSSAGLAAVMQLDSALGFLRDREETVPLAPMAQVPDGGYVWRTGYHRRCS